MSQIITGCHSALPPDVRRGFAPPQAARFASGYALLMYWVNIKESGRSPLNDYSVRGGAKPRLTSGGKADSTLAPILN
jgi:hypothetical protein